MHQLAIDAHPKAVDIGNERSGRTKTKNGFAHVKLKWIARHWKTKLLPAIGRLFASEHNCKCVTPRAGITHLDGLVRIAFKDIQGLLPAFIGEVTEGKLHPGVIRNLIPIDTRCSACISFGHFCSQSKEFEV